MDKLAPSNFLPTGKMAFQPPSNCIPTVSSNRLPTPSICLASTPHTPLGLERRQPLGLMARGALLTPECGSSTYAVKQGNAENS
jgi:hypothetical protein